MDGLPKCRKFYSDLSKQGRSKRLKSLRSLDSPQLAVKNEEIDTALNSSLSAPGTSRDRFEELDNSESTCNENFEFLQCGSVSDDYSDVDSEDSLYNDETNEGIMEFREDLRNWSVNYQVTHVALTALLCVLKTHTCFDQLPETARTLLETPVSLPIENCNPGQYCHLGLVNGIKKIWTHVVESVSRVEILIGIDGLPLFKSSPGEVWPILAWISNVPSVVKRVFPVGIYYGKKKPVDCCEFLKNFVSECSTIDTDGVIINGQKILISIKGFVCDAPAKSFILGVKSHTGYSSCTKCKQPGVYKYNKIIFPELNSQLRTHEEFLMQSDEDYHVGQTILHQIPNINFTTSFPLDYMHLICLGVTRTLIYIWKFAPPPLKLSSRLLSSISSNLVLLQTNIPREFSRKPRGLDEVKRWKATEFRQFVLYTGPVILKDIMLTDYPGYYDNFLSLHIATRILVSKKYFKHLEYAKGLMRYFIETVKHCYGPQFITHNFHNLLHITDDVSVFGNLDTFSAFKFENYLGKMKKLIKSGNKPLQQIARRLVELEATPRSRERTVISPGFSKPHFNGPELSCYEFKEQFKQLTLDNFTIKSTFPDSCCSLSDGRIVIVYNFGKLKSSDEMCVLFKEYLTKEDFFSQPFCKSSELDIFSVKNLSDDLQICPINLINQKMVLLNHCNGTVVLPLLNGN